MAASQISVFTIYEALIVEMLLPHGATQGSIDIAFHLDRMGDHGVLKLVLSLVNFRGVIENYTSAVRIDSLSHGGIYYGVDFGLTAQLEPRVLLEVEGEADLPAMPPASSSPIQVDPGSFTLHERLIYRHATTLNHPVRSISLIRSPVVYWPQDDESEKLRGSEMV